MACINRRRILLTDGRRRRGLFRKHHTYRIAAAQQQMGCQAFARLNLGCVFASAAQSAHKTCYRAIAGDGRTYAGGGRLACAAQQHSRYRYRGSMQGRAAVKLTAATRTGGARRWRRTTATDLTKPTFSLWRLACAPSCAFSATYRKRHNRGWR